VPAWKSVYSLRVLVFVEYENEVYEERARVRALLEKLRIDAEVLVFSLASGQLNTYEVIINGHCNDPDSEALVNNVLKNEDWWEELQSFRAGPNPMTPAEEFSSLATILDSTIGRPGVYNPHTDYEEFDGRRRSITAVHLDLPKRSTVARLSRLGVNVGIHTHYLGDEVFDDSDSSSSASGEDEAFATGSDVDFDDAESAASDGDIDTIAAVRRPLLSVANRRKSHGDSILQREPHKRVRAGARKLKQPEIQSYGAIKSQTLAEWQRISSQESERTHTASTSNTHHSDTPRNFHSVSARSMSPVRIKSSDNGETEGGPGNAPPIRPVLSRSSSAVRFSSRPVPETRIDVEESSGPTIMFADTMTDQPNQDRDLQPRHPSTGFFSSRPVPETRVGAAEGSAPTIRFAESTHLRYVSTESGPDMKGQDARVNIPELLRNYRLHSELGDDDGGSTYSTQGVALSFNDLPSRAQHLILNELMNQNSGETAVVFTTLPIPAEGTCEDEEATVKYLSDVEILCHDLPPVLLVLSNNMTVTVSL
jgi:solute carrier family 12 (potassium/chloride transporters), member 9